MSLIQADIQDGVLVLTLNDPSRRNMLSREMCVDFSSVVTAAADDLNIRAIVVTGAGSVFCAGADLADLRAAVTGSLGPINAVYKAFMDVAMSPLPTLAAVNGAAVGAGFNLALACDMRIACDEASFDTRFMKLALHPGGGHAWMLLKAIGWAQTSQLLLAGHAASATDALRIGLVGSIEPASGLLKKALDIFKETATVPRELILRTKATLRHAERSSHQQALDHETEEQLWSLRQPAFIEAVSRLRQS